MKMKNVSEEELLRKVTEDASSGSDEDDGLQQLRCWDCNVDFTTKSYLYRHLFHHIKQPRVKLVRVALPPLRITLKNTKGNSFEIIHSPNSGKYSDQEIGKLEEIEKEIQKSGEGSENNSEGESITLSEFERRTSQSEASDPLLDGSEADLDDFDAATLEDINGIIESETGAGSSGTEQEGSSEENMVTGPIITEITDDNETGDKSPALSKSTPDNSYDTIPGAEPTPPPEPSPDTYPKIRIKTTGLLKDPIQSCTITEITADNPNGEPINNHSSGGHLWSTPSLEDPLKLPDSDDNILSLFNNNDRAKDFGFTSSDSEYISLDRLDNRGNSGALQLYNPPTSSSQNPLDSLTGLPMQALAQQVSRLQPSGNGMHQQNVLINIQQFPQAPPQAPYQPPPMYHHSTQPMYPQPYQYQPPTPMYYTPPSYPPPPQHMQQPQLPQLTQMGQPQMNPPNSMGQPPMSQAQAMPPSSQSGHQSQGPMNPQGMGQQQQQQQNQYRQTVPRPPGIRQPMTTGQRMPTGPRQPMNPRGPPMATRQRAPIPRPRGPVMSNVRGVRTRMPNGATTTQFRSPLKRSPEQIKQEQNVLVKKKRFDMLTPDKDDDDCQVICMQPKNTDGLPQIESVQGGTPEPAESSIMHLSDSITLSVRNPPPKPASPKKSDAKAVANILATRGITVTPTAKPKEKSESPVKSQSPLNLNGAVSIIPSAKQQTKKTSDAQLPTVDLTDDSTPVVKQSSSPQKSNLGLPYRCYLCPAQYPNALGLSKHRQNYHKTSGGVMDLGIPLINLKQPGIIQKLEHLGIHNFIPLPTSQPDGTFAIPIIKARSPGNVHAMGATTMLVLGPVKTIPRPGTPSAGTNPTKPPGTPQK